ncbi:MAG: hypothetical protein AMJ81_13835, partial [Phycisphaerae bacterium SM23_33]
KILAQLTAEAEAYVQAGGDGGPGPSKAVESVEYSAASVERLQGALRFKHKDPLAELYVAYQLLQPLYQAGNELLRKFQPMMNELLGRCRYEAMPNWPRQMLSDLNVPEKLPKLEQKLRMQRRDAALAKKRAAEQAVVKRNRTVNALEKTLKELMVLMADEKADDAVLERLAEEVKQRWTTFEVTLSALREQAVDMKQPQAKKYYHRMIQQARQIPGQKEYADPARPKYSDKENSSFHSKRMYFAKEAVLVVNVLAVSAREPAVIIPGEKPPGRKPGERPGRPRGR